MIECEIISKLMTKDMGNITVSTTTVFIKEESYKTTPQPKPIDINTMDFSC